MGLLLVTIGTDGATDWVQLPDGQKLNLGTVSVLQLVSKAVKSWDVKGVMNAFLAKGEATAKIEEGVLWSLLEPKRVRLSAHSPSMSPVSMSSGGLSEGSRNLKMATIFDDLTAIERHIAALDEAAAKRASNLSQGVQHLVKLAGKIQAPKSVGGTYYGLGSSEAGGTRLSFDTYEANTTVATTIAAKAEETLREISACEAKGRKFNADRARLDVREVTVKVAGILRTDLTASWVSGDLQKLAGRMDEIHSLFVPKA